MSFLKLKVIIFWSLLGNKILFWKLIKKFLFQPVFLFWLVLSHSLPKISLVAYHSIQKEKFYLLGQKIKSPYLFLITFDRIFEKVPCIASKLSQKKPKPLRSFFGDSKDGVHTDAISVFLVTPFNNPRENWIFFPENFFVLWFEFV